ncbi:uncharacterized protein hmgxb4b isoform 2-T2 [Menidia menidia]
MNGDLHIMSPGEKQRLYKYFLVDLEDLKEGDLQTEECSSKSFHQESNGSMNQRLQNIESSGIFPPCPLFVSQVRWTEREESPIPTEEHRECLDNQHNMAEGQEQKPVSDRQHVSVPVSVSLAALAGPEVSDVISDDPVSAAAHLHLLGEALSLIGRHLQETNKMVCMSGTLSLLLDSLLCALAPLMCLTTQIPELTSDTECPLAPTLENIAYVMPGL